MKNIEKRDVLRKAEIAAEYLTAIEIAKKVDDSDTVSSLSGEYEDYCESTQTALTSKQVTWFHEEISRLGAMSSLVSSLIVNGNEEYLSGSKVIHTAKSSMSGGVNSKEDFEIVTANGKRHKFSLKQYKEIDNVQVASGTWLSTLAGLAFEPTGRGSFTMPDGTKIVSKNTDLLMEKLVEYYGEEIREPISELIRQTKEVHKFRYEEWKPKNWSSKDEDCCTKSAGRKAAPYFMEALQVISSRNPQSFKERMLNRIGLSNSSGEKELIFVDGKGKFLSSFCNPSVANWVVELSRPSTNLRMLCKNQSVEFYFDSESGSELLKFAVPLTINSNGAWVSNSGFHKKEGIYLEAGQRRPKKSMELDTSTNCWLKTPKKLIKKIK